MIAYWLRVLGAVVLLRAAGRIMKDAEDLLGVTHETRDYIEAETVTEVTGNNGAVSEEVVTNG